LEHPPWSSHLRGTKTAMVSIEALCASPGGAAVGADLGGSSKLTCGSLQVNFFFEIYEKSFPLHTEHNFSIQQKRFFLNFKFLF